MMANPAHDELRQLLRARRPGHGLDRRLYTDPAIYQADLELLWYREWLFVGHDCELPRAGDYVTLQVGDYPLLILRDNHGAVRAFHNTCRHRGSRICTEDRGHAPRLVCPYHQWSYDLDGRLLSARQMGEGFDKSGVRLGRVACESVAGYLFICLAEEPPDFAPLRARMEPCFAPHRLAEAKVACERTIVEKGNWKLVWENNRECYHCAVNHPELCVAYPEAPSATGVQGAATDPAMLAHWQHCEAAGLPSRFSIDPGGQHRVVRIPLLPGTSSYTLDGQPAVRRRLSDTVTAQDIGALLLFHYPTTWNHVMRDHAVTFRMLPLGPDETAVTTRWLVHRDAVEGVDYDQETLTHVWMQTNDQDRRIVEENARGIRSPAYVPGPCSTVHEDGVLQFLAWYEDTVLRRLEAQGTAQ